MNSFPTRYVFAWLICSALVCLTFHAQAATYTVSNTDSDGAGSLAQAVADANGNPDADTITFSVSGTITTSATLTISESVTIDGPGSDALTVDGNDAHRVFSIDSTGVTIKGLTITGGSASGAGGGIYMATGAALDIESCVVTGNQAGSNISGGGLYNFVGTLNISDCTVSENSAPEGGGGVMTVNGTTTIVRSAIIDNNVSGEGGGIYCFTGTVNVVNSTISGNTSGGDGGGILIGNTGTLNLANVTISDNDSTAGDGDGIYNTGTINLVNTIIADNDSTNCDTSGGTMTSEGHNLDSGNSCGLTGTGDVVSTDPLLGAIGDNGGPTVTYALQPGSPAIDSGDDGTCPDVDQRGTERPQDGDDDGAYVCDMGAYEACAGDCETSSPGGDADTDTDTDTDSGSDSDSDTDEDGGGGNGGCASVAQTSRVTNSLFVVLVSFIAL